MRRRSRVGTALLGAIGLAVFPLSTSFAQSAPGGHGGTFSGFTSAQPRVIPERGEIWFTDQDRGFYVVRFTNGVWPFRALAGE